MQTVFYTDSRPKIDDPGYVIDAELRKRVNANRKLENAVAAEDMGDTALAEAIFADALKFEDRE